ncbi:MAG: hypothetical protein GYA15_11860, partial [Leptolinea sp.]|nr:hypothetical protein [Leptolinea sp.]
MITWNFNPYAIALLCTGFLSLTLSIQLFLRWANRECVLLGFAVLMIAEWSFFVGLESAVQQNSIKVLFSQFSYFGVFNCLPFVLLFVLYFFDFKTHIHPGKIFLLWVLPNIIFLLAATNNYHHLIWSEYVTPSDAPYNTLVYHRGPLYWLGVIYNYSICMVIS